jgi:AraC-like DNA-binding protein
MKSDNIPLFKYQTYQNSYLKEEYRKNESLASSSSIKHFDIHKRCTFNDTIQSHRLDFYAVFIVTKGEGIHSFGIREHYIKNNMLCFIGPDMISSWQSETNEHQGIFCSFSDSFFYAGKENKYFLSELPFFKIDGNSVLHLTDEQMQYYLSLFNLMYEEHQQQNEYADDVLRSYVQLILSKANSQYHTEQCRADKPDKGGLSLLKGFTALFMRDFKAINEGKTIQLKKIADYALELGVSQNHLNDTIKDVTGKSAGQLVKAQLLKHATMCLTHSEKSISEIAYRLGYEDPSYFARFYKKHTGHSPSEIREHNL